MITTLRLAAGVGFCRPVYVYELLVWSQTKGLPGNRSFYENSEVDKLLRNALATTDQTQRTRDYQQAQKIVIDDAAYVYLFQKNYQLAMNKEVKGFVFNPMLEQVFNINTMSK